MISPPVGPRAAIDLHNLKSELTRDDPERIARDLPTWSTTDQAIAFRLLPKNTALYVFELLTPSTQRDLVEALGHDEAVGLLESLDADDRARLLDELPAKVAKHLIAGLAPDTRAGVQTMLGYGPGTVGRVLSPAYVAVRHEVTAADALDMVRRSDLRTEHLSTVFVIDADRRYQGLVDLAELVRATPETPVVTMVRAAEVAVRAPDPAAGGGGGPPGRGRGGGY
jgi:magnesium transporter